MFKPHKGTCVSCEKTDTIIVVKAGLCMRCNHAKKAAGKKKPCPTIAELRSSLKKKPRKPTGELELFKLMWEEDSHVCRVTGTLIRRFDVSCFSHLLPKGLYPDYRLLRENVWIVQPHIHNQWEYGNRNDAIFRAKNDEAERLKIRYNEEHKQKTFKP